jgi:hypothetical protein
MGFKPISQAAYEAGLASGRDRLARASTAEAVRYDSDSDRIVIVFPGCEIVIPRDRIEEFDGHDARAMSEIRLSAIGDALAIGHGDVHVDIDGLLADLLPATAVAKAIAKRGGRSTSPAKSMAARKNGAKGGRPRKRPAA